MCNFGEISNLMQPLGHVQTQILSCSIVVSLGISKGQDIMFPLLKSLNFRIFTIVKVGYFVMEIKSIRYLQQIVYSHFERI